MRRKDSPVLEKTFQSRVLKKLRTLPHTWYVKVSDRVKSGIPDILMCVGGIFVAMELKRSKSEKPTPLQAHILSEIERAGGHALKVDPENWDETWEMLLKLAEGKPS